MEKGDSDSMKKEPLGTEKKSGYAESVDSSVDKGTVSSGQIRLPSWVIVALVAIASFVLTVIVSISVGVAIGFSTQEREISELRQLLEDTHEQVHDIFVSTVIMLMHDVLPTSIPLV